VWLTDKSAQKLMRRYHRRQNLMWLGPRHASDWGARDLSYGCAELNSSPAASRPHRHYRPMPGLSTRAETRVHLRKAQSSFQRAPCEQTRVGVPAMVR
jgi:hypothetical protein